MVSSAVLVGGAVGLIGFLGITVYPSLKAAPFAYGSARVRAARAKLLSHEELKSLAADTYKDVLYQLEKRGFHDLLGLLDKDFGEELVQAVLRQNYRDALLRIIRYVPREMEEYFRVLESKAEREFVISVLRSKTNPYYERHLIDEMFVATEHFDEGELSDIAKMPLQDFIARLKKTAYGEVVSAHAERIKEGDLVGFEDDMAKGFYEALRRAAGGDQVLRSYAKLRADKFNIKRALTFRGQKMMPFGSLPSDVVSQLESAKALKDVQAALERTPFGPYVKESVDIAGATKALYTMEKDYAGTLAGQTPLSVAPLLSYYIASRIEMKNVAVVLKLVHSGFPSGHIMEALI